MISSAQIYAKMEELSNLNVYRKEPKSEILNKAYQYFKAEKDFIQMTFKSYLEMRNDSILAAEGLIFDSASIGSPSRIEPMKTLADASTSGKKTSSNVNKVGYFKNMLEVEFKGGERYIYFVGPDFYDNMVASGSKGSFIWDELRGKDPGLTWSYVYGGAYSQEKTAGGVGSTAPEHKLYAKGTGGTPDYKPKMPTDKERETALEELRKAFEDDKLDVEDEIETEAEKEIETEIPEVKPKPVKGIAKKTAETEVKVEGEIPKTKQELRKELDEMGQDPKRDDEAYEKLKKKVEELYKFKYIPKKRPKSKSNPKGAGKKRKQGRPLADFLEEIMTEILASQIYEEYIQDDMWHGDK